MKWVYYIIGMLLFSTLSAQVNYVQNGSFEELISCPNDDAFYSTIQFALGWENPISNQVQLPISPDLFNTCINGPSLGVPTNWYGFQFPIDGNGYSGIVLGGLGSNSREFIQNSLLLPLKANCKYNIDFDFSYASSGSNKCSNLYFIFSNSKIMINDDESITSANYFELNLDSITIVPFPEIIVGDTLNWTHLEKEFYTNASAKYLTIGNIDDSLNTYMEFGWVTNFFGIQPVSRIILDDIKLFQLDSTYCTTSIENVKEDNDILLYPNPTSTLLTIQSSGLKPGTVLILNDLSGRLIKKIELHEFDIFQLNTQDFGNGIYWVSIIGRDGKQRRERFIVMHE